MLAAPGAALAGPDVCTITGTAPNQTATCTGNQSAGIRSGGGGDFSAASVTVLEVNGLASSITPAPGVNADGIRFSSNRDVTVRSTANLSVSGAFADGIEARTAFGGAAGSGGNVVIDSTGTITSADARGINAYAGNTPSPSFNISVTNDGAITSRKEGIYARSWSGTVTIDTTGKIISSDNAAIEPFSARDSIGIHARTSNRGASSIGITNSGDIEVTSFGVYALSYGAITIDSTGAITSGIGQLQSTNYGDGIRARLIGNPSNPAASVGNITITNSGDIQAADIKTALRK